MKPGPLWNDPGPRGISCPRCMRSINLRKYAADTQPTQGGTWRKRICDCGYELETIEAPIGQHNEFLDVSDLDKGVVEAMRKIIRNARFLAEKARQSPIIINTGARAIDTPLKLPRS